LPDAIVRFALARGAGPFSPSFPSRTARPAPAGTPARHLVTFGGDPRRADGITRGEQGGERRREDRNGESYGEPVQARKCVSVLAHELH